MSKFLAYFFGALVVVPLLLAAIAWVFLHKPDRTAAELEAKYIGSQDHFADLPGGLRLHYREQGDKDKPVLLLLHGYGDSYATWDAWAQRLQDRYRVISLDLPGHGLTAAPADTVVLDPDAFAGLVVAFAERLQLAPFTLVGNSMGGGIAWKVALLAPEKLHALVLVDAAGWPANTAGQSPSLAFRVLQHPIGRWVLARIDNKPLIKQGLNSQVYDKTLITDAVIEQWADYQLYPGHRRILMSGSPSRHAQATTEQLAAIKLPTLVLHGEFDPLIPVENGRKFAAAIAGAQLITYPQVGHLPQREIPEKSADDLAAFLSKLP